jgi:hypothetical protein
MVADRIFPGLITGRTRSRHTCLNPYSITALAASLGKPLCEAHRLSVICVDRRPATSSVTSQVMAIALWPAAPSRSAILRTAGSLISTIHDGQGLPLRLEASNHLALSSPRLSSFRATLRRRGCVCSATKTTPKTLHRFCSSSLYAPMKVPVASVGPVSRMVAAFSDRSSRSPQVPWACGGPSTSARKGWSSPHAWSKNAPRSAADLTLSAPRFRIQTRNRLDRSRGRNSTSRAMGRRSAFRRRSPRGLGHRRAV